MLDNLTKVQKSLFCRDFCTPQKKEIIFSWKDRKKGFHFLHLMYVYIDYCIFSQSTVHTCVRSRIKEKLEKKCQNKIGNHSYIRTHT